MAIESEIKLTIPNKVVLDRIRSLKDIGGYGVIDKGLKRIIDTNFDTDDSLLFRSKVVFRLRVMDHKSVLTFKAKKEDNSAVPGGLIHRRIEIESETSAGINDIALGNLPDIPPVKGLHDMLGNIPLSPSLTTVNNRHTLLLTYHNTPYYELVLDDVAFRGVRGTATVYELEIEPLFDTDNDLESLGEWFQEQFGLAPAGPSKYILGMTLVGNAAEHGT